MSSPRPTLNGRQLGKNLAAGEPVRDEHDVARTFARRAISDAQVPVHRIARLREHCGSLSRGAGQVPASSKSASTNARPRPWAFFAHSVPSPRETLLGMARSAVARRHSHSRLAVRKDLRHHTGERAALPQPVPTDRRSAAPEISADSGPMRSANRDDAHTTPHPRPSAHPTRRAPSVTTAVLIRPNRPIPWVP